MCVSRFHRVVERAGPGVVRTVDADGSTHRVSLLALGGPEPPPGSWLVVHSGYAIDRVDESEATEVLELQRHAGAALAPSGPLQRGVAGHPHRRGDR
jgi:hydrogenase maturation factor